MTKPFLCEFRLSAMTTGRTYAELLAEAQVRGYTGTDPTADVEGYDALAQTRIVAAVAFKQQLQAEQVARSGITTIQPEPLQEAVRAEKRVKSLVTVERKGNTLEASVALRTLPLDDPLARVEGTTNALTIQTKTPSEVTITGPGSSPLQIAQSLFSDLLAFAR